MKLITFDFWNTLFLDRHEGIRHSKRVAFAHEVLQRYHPSLPETKVAGGFEKAHQEYLRQWENRRAFTMDLHVGHMLRCLHLAISAADFRSIVDYFESVLLEYPPVVIDHAVEAVRHVASRMKVGLISDTGYSPGRTLRQILAGHNMENCFHAFSFSNETGFLKPNPQAFGRILEKLDIRPEDAVHVGDLEETDIAGAKKIGMKAIRYVGADPVTDRQSIADAVIDDLGILPFVLNDLFKE